MQSPIGGVFRSLVVLVCLLVVPWIALSGMRFPEPVQQWLSSGRGANCPGSTAASFPASGTQPSPSSQPAGASRSGGMTGGWLPGDAGLSLSWPASQGGAAVGAAGSCAPNTGEARGRNGAVIPTTFLEAETTGGGVDSPKSGGTSKDPSLRPPESVPDDRATSAVSAGTVAGAIPESVAGAPQAADRLVYVQQRLRSLGAHRYSLELWGHGKEYYKFHCSMPIAGSPTAVRYFEATDADGLKAMSKVLEEVETWRASLR